ncbi:hypothetical protein REMIM1_CH01449 [Rhizobium etli bv. mimosae str. Mim1]|nr:hypothetical protein REMIM1_CH01449 [Rhizobium etli bv. mimosae str. Mim1]
MEKIKGLRKERGPSRLNPERCAHCSTSPQSRAPQMRNTGSVTRRTRYGADSAHPFRRRVC